MSFEWTLAWRYFWSKRNHPFIHVIRQVSVAGVAVGVCALIVVLAVMNGFERDLKSRIIGTYAHTIIGSDQNFHANEALYDRVKRSSPAVRSISPFVQGQVLIEVNRNIEGVMLRGAEFATEHKVTSVDQHIQKGKYPSENVREVMLGSALAKRLDLKIGDEIRIISPVEKKTNSATLSGIFESGMYEYDAHLAYTSLKFAQELYVLGDRVSGLALSYSDADEALKQKARLKNELGYPFFVRTWMDMNQNLFSALQLERTVMFVILTLIVLVACFNIIGTLTLLVIDKTRDIGILKSLGASSGQILRIFTLNGLLIGLVGTVCGLVMGVGLCLFLKTYPVIRLPSEIYYFDRLPVLIQWHDLGMIALCAMAMSLISTWYPAKAGSALKPVDSIRFRE